MSHFAVDRNLLFGILALQTNFISREALLAAFAAWVADKGRPLGEILCQQGKLTQSQSEVLRALTDEHVKHHGNDSNQSLGAITSLGWLWAELLKLNDPQLNEWLGKSFPSVSFVPVSQEPGQRFRILRHHAKGGQGMVSVALDTELQREVALKQIKPEYADNTAVRARFVHEAEITGSLEHPGIVPVYGLGRSLEGRPFYAMRFIRGDSLWDALQQFHKADLPGRDSAERTLKLRELLGRFIDVCDAIEYAHSRGVLHRDLKPENIVLGKYGETLLIDLGLAKATGRDELAESDITERPLPASSGHGMKETMQGSAVGTPAYMSPEQAAGRIDLVTEATDVYGLGATLYCLLTGQPPFVGNDKGDILIRVERGEFPPPREMKPQISAALEAICLKAMSLKPADRYSSPKKLSADIAYWLADEPVACYPEPPLLRTRRWVKRHPTLIVGTSATVLISLVSLAVIASIVGQSNRSLAAKNLELDLKNTALKQANQRERDATMLAQENASIARDQSNFAMETLETVIFDIQTKLRNIPGAGDLQHALLQTAMERLQQFSDRFAARSMIDHNTTAALMELGDLFLRIGSLSPRPDNPGSGAVGAGAAAEADTPMIAARKVYQQAFDIAHKFAAAEPNNDEAQRDLSLAYDKLGNLSLQAGQVTDALEYYQHGLRISQQLAAANRTTDTSAKGKRNAAEAQRDLSISYNKLGNVYLKSGQVTEALEYYQKCLEIRQRLVAADATDAQAQRDLSVSFEKLGDVHLKTGQVEQALTYYRKCLEIGQQLAAAAPRDVQAQRDLSVSYEKLGDVGRQTGELTAALEHYQQSLEIRQQLAAADPADVQAQLDLYVSHQKQATVQQRQGQYAPAIESYGHGLKLLKSLNDQNRLPPQNVRHIEKIEQSIQQCQLAPTALGDWKTLLEQPADVLPVLLEMRGTQFVQKGRVGDAVQAVAKLRELGTATAGQLYNAACVYSLCAAGVQASGRRELAETSKGSRPPLALTAEQAAERQKHIDDALETLREAIKAGWNDFAHIQKDPDLTVLRDLPEFLALLPK